MNEYECRYLFEPVKPKFTYFMNGEEIKTDKEFMKDIEVTIEVTNITELYDVLKQNGIEPPSKKWYPFK